jgi:hypothetical protein
MKKWLVISWLVLLFAGVSYLFWYNEWRYSLPTPVPENYHIVETGAFINLAGNIKETTGPLLLHFFNPDCPCSKFNIEHFKWLVKHYSNKVSFAVVVMSKDTTYTADDIQQKFGLTIPVLFDQSIAAACGVYSTPQAVLLDAGHKLYYRGNYNKSRYCTDKNSNYVQMAIDSLLINKPHPIFSRFALKSYGCTLPTCKK